MKKITLVLCLSFVGLVGFSQQTSEKMNEISSQDEVLVIDVGSMDFEDAADQELLTSNDFKEMNFNSGNFEKNNHELVHRSSNQNNLENKFKEGAFSYNEYVMNIDFSKIVTKKLKI